MKTLLLKKQDLSFWVSCQSITRNLTLAYQHLLKDHLSVWNYDESQSAYEVLQLAKKIKHSGFEQIVWVDHHPHPQKLVAALEKQFSKETKKPELYFHLFGDFSLFAPQWNRCSSLLESFPVRFICASTNQAKFVKSFLQDEEVLVAPFPVDESAFYFSQKERKQWRDQHNMTENSKVVLYTGRLSLQKNIVEMMRVFSRVKKLMGENDVRLFMAGPLDDLGLPFVGKRGLPGSFFRLWHKEWVEQKELVEKQQLIYLGEQNAEQLRAAYCGADLFCSLSTHNDEDYGMSAAEASCTGLPLLLSQWGGFPDFVNFQRRADVSSSLVPVKLKEGPRPLPEWAKAQKEMFSQLHSTPLSSEKREELAKSSQAHLGVLALSNELKKLYENKASVFRGFNKRFSRFSSAFEARPDAPFANMKGQYNDLFKQSYRPYVKPGDRE